MTAGEGLLLTNWRVGGVILFNDVVFFQTTNKHKRLVRSSPACGRSRRATAEGA